MATKWDIAKVLAELIGRADDLAAAVKTWTIKTGTALVNDTDKDSTLVQSLLDLKDKLDTILAESFESHPAFARVRSQPIRKLHKLVMLRFGS
jgi:molybdopterin-guanine dinucleotide biosynthesis protein